MTDNEIKIVFGGLLHDIGKIVYRTGDDRRKHSQSGFDFLKEEAALEDTGVLDCVRYHHSDAIRNASVKMDSPAYIIYQADNIASAVDRRELDSPDYGFEISTPLKSIFNLLNGNSEDASYRPGMLNPEDEINYPENDKILFDESFYKKIMENVKDNLRGIEWSIEYINSLLQVLEANLSYVPSSTSKGEVADISLYDHLKMTAAVGHCIHRYIEKNNISDYKSLLYDNGKDFQNKSIFLLYSMDISGIQDFIYTISSKNALKMLRSRSFYLEIMMEHIIDTLLDKLNLTRANLLYVGGGHCYMLLPNTDEVKILLDENRIKLNEWFLEYFQTSLYIADGYCECSAAALKNHPAGSYEEIFRTVSRIISDMKMSRYTPGKIWELNKKQADDYARECRVCRGLYRLKEDTCQVCSALIDFSKEILNGEFFSVTLDAASGGLPLPGDMYLLSDTEKQLKKRIAEDNYFVRAYSKNSMYTGKYLANRIWVGDYVASGDFSKLADESGDGNKGVRRLGVLRADVDNLGQSFVSGFKNAANNDRYVTISRTAALSRQLSLFFKLHINKILKNPVFSIDGTKKDYRNIVICYSGGDDVFLVGAWNEIIEAAVDIRRAFKKYTQNTLSISAGVGIYDDGYPVSAMAVETALLEDKSKKYPGKNAVSLPASDTFSWDLFEEKVIGEKYNCLTYFFANSDDKGMNFMYTLLELIRGKEEKINFARFVYLLSRFEPAENDNAQSRERYRQFFEKMCKWYRQSLTDDTDLNQLQQAMQLYSYMNRERMG